MSDSRNPKPGDKIFRPGRTKKFHLRRVLGTAGLFSAAYGDVGSSIYYALGVVAMSALGLTPPVLMISGLVFLFTALTYAEGATMLPEAGGSGAFAYRAFNPLVSFIASWVLMLDYIVTMSISAFSAVNYLGYIFPALGHWPADSIGGIVVVVFLAYINIRGLQASSRLNIIMVMVDLLTQITIAILAALLVVKIPTLIHNIHWGVAPTTNQFLFGVSISMVAYTGIETVSNLGSEAKDPGKSIPRAVIFVFITVFILWAVLSMAALSAYPVHQAANGTWVTDLTQKYLHDPILGIAYVMPVSIRHVLSFWVAFLAVTILIIATNAGMLGASRLAYFMGQRQQLPGIISKVSRRARVPLNAILVFSVIASVLIGIGHIGLLADLYAFGAVLAYTLAHASIIALRIKEPSLPRPFKIPVNLHIKGKEIPVSSILGGLATFITWFIVVYTHAVGRVVGFSWLAIGLLIYFLYRRRRGKQPSDWTVEPKKKKTQEML
ncbi:MAG: APC family permease [Dehalococcoidales bacterium]|jgi:APA family basic amino acid/polyamine antiporter